jgi:hypothetical protein
MTETSKWVQIEVSFKDESGEQVKSILEEAEAQNIKARKSAGFVGVQFILVGIVLAQVHCKYRH